MSQISMFSFTTIAEIRPGVLLSCILHGLDTQNQERNLNAWTRDTQWPWLKPRSKQRTETRVPPLWRWQPLHNNTHAAEISKRHCVRFPMSLCSGPWHRVTLAALMRWQCCAPPAAAHRECPGREVSFAPTPGLRAEVMTHHLPGQGITSISSGICKTRAELKGSFGWKKITN